MTRDPHSGGSGRVPSSEEIHSILSSEERRHVVRFFEGREGNLATLDELADFLLDRVDGFDDSSEVKIVLHHSTLPKLDDIGAVEYDYRTNVTRYYGQSRLTKLVSVATVE